ncbi:MAG: hypothetical protein AMXMBFR59_38500 [Rhodanobacteraceae bacterium]
MSKRSSTTPDSEDYLFSQEYDPDQTEILGRSILDLFRAFSNNSMVAFIGSGTSLALGYPSWDRFAREFMAHVITESRIALRDKQDDPKYVHSVRLARTVEEYQQRFDGSDPARKPALFDMIALASEMAAELQRLRAASRAGSAPSNRLPSSPAADASSPDESLDDFYHRTFRMKGRLVYSPLPAGDAASLPFVQRLQDRLGQLAGLTGAGTLPSVPMSIPPDYVAGDALVRALFPAAPGGTRSSGADGDALTPHRKLLGAQRPSLDVLACLQGNWNINRFVTLNYDHEIERQLEDHTYPFFSLTPAETARTRPAAGSGPVSDMAVAPGTSARSRLGECAVTVDLCPKNTAELLLFAANFSPAHVQVMHLHGSVRDPATMIVTDRDYNRRYFAGGAWPSVLGDGQELLFRGNAILFVGVGMNEDELLRPLRILAQAPSREGRPVFTLLASSSHAEDTALAFKLFQRYGIRTIFYGNVPCQDHEFGDLRDHPLRRAYDAHRNANNGGHADASDPSDLASLQDELDFLDCVQQVIETQKARKAVRTDPPAAATASPASASAEPAAAMTAGATEMAAAHAAQDNDGDHRGRIEHAYATARAALQRAIDDRRAPGAPDSVGRFGPIPTRNLPRLRLTPWHADVFALVSLQMTEPKFEALDSAQLSALATAVSSLRSAIHTRALLDALDFIALRARDWRRRWSRYPGHEHCPPAFRRLPDSRHFPRLLRRHIGMHDNLGISPAFREHSAGAAIGNDVLDQIHGCGKPVVVCLWPSGKGKGYLASLLATDPATDGPHRVVISFNQSCEFDSCFDLIADVIRRSGGTGGSRFDCVLTHVDTVFSKAAGRPLLAEWDAVLRRLITRAVRDHKIRVIVLCEYPSTRDYFATIAGSGAHLTQVPGSRAPHAEADTGGSSGESTNGDHQARDLDAIFARCKSRWLMLFLCQLIDWVEQRGQQRPPEKAPRRPLPEPAAPLLAPEREPGEFGRRLIDEAWTRLRQTQDPRQRVAAVIDAAIAHFERHVIAYGTPPARLQKILAFAILRNLFLLATPVRPELIQHFPEIGRILQDYGMTRHGTAAIAGAVALLEHLRLVIPLHGHHAAAQASTRRIGLHGATRRYLLSKKSLPFTHFGQREHAAITVLPVLAEDVVALEPDDFEFTRELFRGLVAAANEAIARRDLAGAGAEHADDAGGREATRRDDECRVLPAECIRVAFGLLRGSMRLGIVLRAAETASPDHSPLDEYFRQLLSIRRAALRIAACDDPNCQGRSDGKADPADDTRLFAWPLYEREWVWLFNEMGVVRLLQGDMRDACALLEQAIDFEEKRLRREIGYEHLLYQKNGEKRFSVTRLRIFMNLSTAALERGAFDRVARIVQRDIANLQLNLRGLAPGGEATAAHTAQDVHEAATASVPPHRELEILTLVAGLIGARVQYLQGAIGGAEAWLRAQRRWVLKVGVHGLTAAFFKVYADVQQRKGEVARTMKYLAVARTEAQASCRTDVILGVMLAEAEQARDTQAAESALQLRHHLRRLRKIEGEAQRIGLSQVEATVSLVRARLYLGFGEYRSAREDIMKALTMTTAKGMRVKRIAALVILAALMATEDTTDTARHEALQLLSTARAEAERMGYKLAAINAMELEIVLNRRGSVEDWATSRARVAMDARTASSVAG